MGKELFTIEYLLNNISVNHLWKLIGTPLGLSEWFSEEVTVSGNEYVFSWDGNEQTANLLKSKKEEFIKFQWKEDEIDSPETYFQFEILTSELSNAVSLRITDFAESDDDKEDIIIMWDSQVEILRRKNGL